MPKTGTFPHAKNRHQGSPQEIKVEWYYVVVVNGWVPHHAQLWGIVGTKFKGSWYTPQPTPDAFEFLVVIRLKFHTIMYTEAMLVSPAILH